MPTNKQRREQAQRRLQRQLERREQLARKRRRNLLIGVTVVRPGFVHTKMTEGLSPAPLSTTPEAVADVIVSAVQHGREQAWAPAPLRFVMSSLRHVPRPIFRRLPL